MATVDAAGAVDAVVEQRPRRETEALPREPRPPSTSGLQLAWRLTLAIVKVGGLFAGLAITLLALVWGLAWLFGIESMAWVGVLNAIAILLVLGMVPATLLIIAERKWSARLQNRIGPNRARLLRNEKPSLWGLPHLVADAIKMIVKEDFVPPQSSKLLFNLAPMMAFAPAFVLLTVVPIGPDLSAFGTEVRFQVARIDMGILFIFAAASLAVYGTTLAGWSSNNKFGLLGGLRASAQMISYEVTLTLTLVGAFMLYETLRLESLAVWQDAYVWGFLPRWGILYQPFAFIFFLAAAFAEIKRAPFDVPESESEIVGYFVEYSGLKFGMFMIAEFVEIVALSGLITVVFFGGWSIPWIPHELLSSWLAPLGDWGALLVAFIGLFVFIVKMMFFVWLQMMIRWTFPRFRYDQLMDLGWKMLLPLSIANVVITAVAIVVDPGLDLLLAIGLVELLVLVGLFATAAAPKREAPQPEPEPALGH